MPPALSLNTLVMRAAVSGWFDPHALLADVADDRIDSIAGDLSLLCDENAEASTQTWMLKPAERRKALESLDRPIAVTAALDGAPPVEGDLFGWTLRAVLEDRPLAPVPDGLASDDADAVRHAALQFASFAPVVDEERRTALYDQTRASIALLQEESELAVVLPARLIGRAGELARILAFAAADDPDRRPLLVTGIGGVGKSALIAAAVRASRAQAHVALVIDFDRPDLTGADPMPVMREILRRLETAWLANDGSPDWTTAVAELKSLRELIRIHQTREGSASAESQLSFVTSIVSGFHAIPAEIRQRPVLIVFDSFEVVGVLGAAAVHRLLAIAGLMQSAGGCSALRVVVSGRACPLPEDDTVSPDGRPIAGAVTTFGPMAQRVDVGGFSDEEGAEFLALIDRGNRFAAVDTRRELSRALRGHPLALIVLERFARQRPATEIGAIVADLGSDPGFSAELAQSFLYTRILERIRDEDVEKLAHPGLVLRRVTPDLVRLVLAEPCGLGAVDAARADALLAKLAGEFWLVERIDARQVRHRADLRRLMLPGLFAGPRSTDTAEVAGRKRLLREATLAACRLADAYYEQGPSSADPARAPWEQIPGRERWVEATYYRALAGAAPPERLPESRAVDLRDMLGADLETLPPAWRALVKATLGDFAGLSDIERRSLAGPLREQAEAADIDVKIRTGQGLEAAAGAVEEQARRDHVRREAAGSVAESAAAADLVSASVRRAPGTLKLDLEREVSATDLRLSEQQVQSLCADAYFGQATTSARLVVEQFFQGRASDTTLKESSSGKLWSTGLWQSALLATDDGVGPDPLYPGSFAVTPPLSPISMLLMAGLLNPGLPATEDWLKSLAQVTGLSLQSFHLDGVRLVGFLVARLGGVPANLERTIDPSWLALFHPAFVKSLAAGTEAPRLSVDRFASQHGTLTAGRFTLRDLESLYATAEVAGLPSNETIRRNPRSFLDALVGLVPELYDPAARLMHRLDSTAAARLAEAAASAATFWPSDLWVMQDEQQAKPNQMLASAAMLGLGQMPRSRRPYQPELASTIVQTADRCGVLDVLLREMAAIQPEAAVLRRMQTAIATRLFSAGLKEGSP